MTALSGATWRIRDEIEFPTAIIRGGRHVQSLIGLICRKKCRKKFQLMIMYLRSTRTSKIHTYSNRNETHDNNIKRLHFILSAAKTSSMSPNKKLGDNVDKTRPRNLISFVAWNRTFSFLFLFKVAYFMTVFLCVLQLV